MSSADKDTVCRELSIPLRNNYRFVTPVFVRVQFDEYFRGGFAPSERLVEILALLVILGDAEN